MPVSAIFENIEAGANINDIMEWFDGLDRAQVKAVIDLPPAVWTSRPSMPSNAGSIRPGNACTSQPVSARPYSEHRCTERMEPVSERRIAQCCRGRRI